MLIDIFKVATTPEINTFTQKKEEQDESSKTLTKATLALTYKAGYKYHIINAEAWGKTADAVSKLKKGEMIYASGQLTRKEWTDANGYSRHDFVFVIESFNLIQGPQSKQMEYREEEFKEEYN